MKNHRKKKKKCESYYDCQHNVVFVIWDLHLPPCDPKQSLLAFIMWRPKIPNLILAH